MFGHRVAVQIKMSFFFKYGERVNYSIPSDTLNSWCLFQVLRMNFIASLQNFKAIFQWLW